VEQGILPPPERGRPSEYTEEHLRVLDLVRMLKEQYLPLEEIRVMLRDLTTSQIEEYLSKTAPREERVEVEPDTAAEYVTRVLSRGAARDQLKQTAPVPRAPIMPAQPTSPAAAPTPGPRVAPAPYPATYGAPPPEFRPVAPAAPAQQPGAAPAAPPVAAPAHEPYAEPGETWQRVRLGPGLELHYIQSNDAKRRSIVARIVEAARHIAGYPSGVAPARDSNNQTEEQR